MNTIKFDEKSYVMTDQESVLQCLLRHGVNYPNSCRVGVCQSCLMKAEDGVVKAAWQEGLPETLKIQGYFLACMALPDTDIEVAAPNSNECELNARILEIKTLNHNVIQLKLDVENLQDWIPGQYLSLINSEGTMRSYSIANIPSQDGFIELQIKVYSDGSMGQWLVNKAMIHTEVRLRGPFGRCFYFNPDKKSFDILLAGTGTGLAPLIAIIKSALSQNHQGNITLVHGDVTDADIYYQNELEALSEKYNSFVYDPCVLIGKEKFPTAPVEKHALTHLRHPKKTQVYVCGPKETTSKLKKNIFLAGVPSNSILSDVFL